ncbi:MAG TPA: folate-binding protein [Motilibacterales bacterium]|nr:folate-binding protein [Motilibacterales bacterium]
MSTLRAIPAPPGSVDEPVPWHYGDPLGEQRDLAAGVGVVDLSHRDILEVSGPDRLSWLHSLTTAHLLGLAAGQSRLVLILSPHGHVEHELHLVETGDTVLVTVEPGTGEALRAYLDSMRFMLRVEVTARADLAVVWEPTPMPDPSGHPSWLVPGDYWIGGEPTPSGSDRGGDATRYAPTRPAGFPGREVLLPREGVAARMEGGRPVGTWALEALRVAAAVPRLGSETDHRTLPHEVGWIGAGVHLAKGCYRGQEAVARVHNLGRPPRRLALAHIDGSEGVLPAHGDAVFVGERVVGWVGTAAQHHELGPIATVLLKRSTDPQADLVIRAATGDVVASQEVVVIP